MGWAHVVHRGDSDIDNDGRTMWRQAAVWEVTGGRGASWNLGVCRETLCTGGVRGKGAAFKGGLRALVQKRASEIVGYLAISARGSGPTLPWQGDNSLTALPDGTGPT